MPNISSLLLLCLFLAPIGAAAETRFTLAQLDDNAQFSWNPPAPLYQEFVTDSKKVAVPTVSANPSPFRLRGGMLAAPNSRKSLNPDSQDDMLSRFAEQRLLDTYGDEGWQSMAADAELRLAPQRGVVSPYLTGGMAVTQMDMVGNERMETQNATAYRYGGGLAYGLGDALDITAGYRVNRMDDSQLGLSNRERLNVQMLDFGLKLRY